MARSALIRPSRSTVCTAAAVAAALGSMAAGVWLSTSAVQPSSRPTAVPGLESRGEATLRPAASLSLAEPTAPVVEPIPQPGSTAADARRPAVFVPSGGGGTEQPPALQPPSTPPPGGDVLDEAPEVPEATIVGELIDTIDSVSGLPVGGTVEPVVKDVVDPVAELLAPAGLVSLTP